MQSKNFDLKHFKFARFNVLIVQNQPSQSKLECEIASKLKYLKPN
jgi:hypothetical protein